MNEEGTDCNGSSPLHDPNPCPICLGPMVRDSYLDTCFHKFCYNCIVQWTKVIRNKHSHPPSSISCPLCKMPNFSIIHGYNGGSFERHYVNQIFGAAFVLSKAHRYRLQCYYTEPGLVNDVFDVSRYWKVGKYLQQNKCLQGWLKRELQGLMQEEDVDIVMHHLLGLINSFPKRYEHKHQAKTPDQKQKEFQGLVSDAARPFLMARSGRFVDELELFLASGMNVEAYDAVYVQRLGWNSYRGTDVVAEESGGRPQATPYLYIFEHDSDDAD